MANDAKPQRPAKLIRIVAAQTIEPGKGFETIHRGETVATIETRHGLARLVRWLERGQIAIHSGSGPTIDEPDCDGN